MTERVGVVAKIAQRKKHKPVALSRKQYLLATRTLGTETANRFAAWFRSALAPSAS